MINDIKSVLKAAEGVRRNGRELSLILLVERWRKVLTDCSQRWQIRLRQWPLGQFLKFLLLAVENPSSLPFSRLSQQVDDEGCNQNPQSKPETNGPQIVAVVLSRFHKSLNCMVRTC